MTGDLQARAVLTSMAKGEKTPPPVLLIGDTGMGTRRVAEEYIALTTKHTGPVVGNPLVWVATRAHDVDAAVRAAIVTESTMPYLVLIERVDYWSSAEQSLLAGIIDRGVPVPLLLTAAHGVDASLQSVVLPVRVYPLSDSQARKHVEPYGLSESLVEKVLAAAKGRVTALETYAEHAATGIFDPRPDVSPLVLRAIIQRNLEGGMGAIDDYFKEGGTFDELTDALHTDTVTLLRCRVAEEAVPSRLSDSVVVEPVAVAILKGLRTLPSVSDPRTRAHVLFALLLDATAPDMFTVHKPVTVVEEEVDDRVSWDDVTDIAREVTGA